MQLGKPSLSVSLCLRSLRRLKFPLKLSSDGGHGKVIITRMLAASFVGLLAAAAIHYYMKKSKPARDDSIIPRLDRTESGRVGKIERFAHYVGKYSIH